MSLEANKVETSDPDWSKAYRGTKDVPWYLDNINDKVTPETRKLLEEYSSIPPSDVLQHVHTIRDRAWAIRSYPCTGLGTWLDPMLPKSPAYPSIISRLQAGDSLMDIGCFLGQDLRRLVADGAPSHRLYAVDVVSHWDLGYELFRDHDRFAVSFTETDILYPNAAMQALMGTLDIISITHVLHQWDWDDQVRALRQLTRISSGCGASVVGFQVGSKGERERPAVGLAKTTAYWHSPESFQEMWDQVGRETGSKWVSQADLMTWDAVGKNSKDAEYLGEDARILQFVVNRTN